MSVRKLKENKITKDGRSWVFIQYSKGLDGKRSNINQKLIRLKMKHYKLKKNI